MSEHTGFHNKEHYSPDCPKCYGTGEKKLDRPNLETLARKLAGFDNWRFEDLMERSTGFNSGISKTLYRNRANSIIALIPDIEEAKKQERERIFRWVDEFLQPRYSPHDHRMYFKNVPEVTWRNFWQTVKEEK